VFLAFFNFDDFNGLKILKISVEVKQKIVSESNGKLKHKKITPNTFSCPNLLALELLDCCPSYSIAASIFFHHSHFEYIKKQIKDKIPIYY
jgi:hypothetical protein